MPEVTNSEQFKTDTSTQQPAQPLTVEQENNAMLKEILRNVRWVRRIYTTSLIITISLIVLPLIAAAFVLPKFITTFSGIYGQYAQDTGLAPTGNLFDLLKELQNAQQQLNQQQQDSQTPSQ
jgi:hypothetical protein